MFVLGIMMMDLRPMICHSYRFHSQSYSFVVECTQNFVIHVETNNHGNLRKAKNIHECLYDGTTNTAE